jgi:hypothetical protein
MKSKKPSKVGNPAMLAFADFPPASFPIEVDYWFEHRGRIKPLRQACGIVFGTLGKGGAR